jgi:hypothetical protein
VQAKGARQLIRTRTMRIEPASQRDIAHRRRNRARHSQHGADFSSERTLGAGKAALGFG